MVLGMAWYGMILFSGFECLIHIRYVIKIMLELKQNVIS